MNYRPLFPPSPSPFLKWAGGKRQLLPLLLNHLPRQFNNYFEPFLGGGALFFELYSLGKLEGKKVFLGDANRELILTYRALQREPKRVIDHLREFQRSHSKEFYYFVRGWDRGEEFETLEPALRGARFIYLNRTCFNGLWRVNRNGYFNVPMGDYKNPKILDEENLWAVSEALQGVTLFNGDYKELLKLTQPGDFVYLDPPYHPLTSTSNFTSYTKENFSQEEQIKLAQLFDHLTARGVFVLESNSNTPFICTLYRKYQIEIVHANRAINSKASNRGKVEEVLIKGKKVSPKKGNLKMKKESW